MDRNEGLKINQKLVGLVSEKYSQDNILIITSNKAVRMSIKKVLTHFNLSIDKIGVADSYSQAKQLIEMHKPRLIFSTYTLDDSHTSLDILSEHRKLYPNPSESVFCVFSDLDLPYIQSYKFEDGYDELYRGLSSIQNYINGLQAVFIRKLQLKATDKNSSIVRSEVYNNNFDRALEILNNEELEISDADSYSIYAEIFHKQGLLEKALESYVFLLDEDPLNYHALKNTALIYFQMELFEEAYESVKEFREHYKCTPNVLKDFIDILICNRDYIGIVSMINSYIDDTNVDDSTKNKMTRALLIAGRHLKDSSPKTAKTCLADAIRLSGGRNFDTYDKALSEMSEVESLKPFAIELFNKYKSNFEAESKIELVEFFVLKHTFDETEKYAKGLKLIRNNIQDKRIYESVISSGISLGQKKESIEDLVFDACKFFPEQEGYFKNYLTKI